MKRAASAERPADDLPIDAIRVGQRHRVEMGDIAGLAASIAEQGLMHPIVITPERLLVAGERRLMAVRSLGWTTVPVRVVTPRHLLQAELDENEIRSDFTPSEAVAIAKELEPAERAAAKERQGTSGKLPEVTDKGRVRDKVASAVGMSGRTLAKAMAVVDAADADPEMGDLVSDMDATGKVDAAYRKLQQRAGDPMAMTDVHRAKFPHLAAAETRSAYTHAMYAVGNPGKFEPEEWAERIVALGAEDIADVQRHLAYIRRWLDRWDQALAKPALSIVGGNAE